MNIQHIALHNFRRFEHVEIEFDRELTVIVARNGLGKTSVLDAITVTLGTFIGAFDHGVGHGFAKSDARVVRARALGEGLPQFPVRVEASFQSPDVHVVRELSGPKNKTTVKDASALTELGVRLQEMVRTGAQEPLPIVSYYGAGRLWRVHKNMERKKVVSADRTIGYEDCLSPASNFVQCQQWMAKATLARQQEFEPMFLQQEATSLADRIAAIQIAVDAALVDEGWKNFHYSFRLEELAMTHAEHGDLPVSQLSDGMRSMISLVADIAFRCVRLNGFMGLDAPALTNGIVLIDEVDIHLHPEWQQRVIRSLRTAFPRIQFIVTTHSPQVLSTVMAASIRLLTLEPSEGEAQTRTVARAIEAETRGLSSADVLAEVLGTNPVPDVLQARLLGNYQALIQRGRHGSQEALELRSALEQHFGAQHAVLADCDRLIRLQSYKQRLAQ